MPVRPLWAPSWWVLQRWPLQCRCLLLLPQQHDLTSAPSESHTAVAPLINSTLYIGSWVIFPATLPSLYTCQRIQNCHYCLLSLLCRGRRHSNMDTISPHLKVIQRSKAKDTSSSFLRNVGICQYYNVISQNNVILIFAAVRNSEQDQFVYCI